MERPIIFSTPMVRAILAGKKTQTRRVLNPQPTSRQCLGICTDSTNKKDVGKIGFGEDNLIKEYIKMPYQVGDLLWVRETWFEHKGKYYYKADDNHLKLEELGIQFKWKPSIHMPQKAARIFIRVTDVRAEWNSLQPLEKWDEYGWEKNPWTWAITFEMEETK